AKIYLDPVTLRKFGIGRAMVERLRNHIPSIRSAADVERYNVYGVGGIGAKRGGALRWWAQDARNRAIATAPSPLASEIAQIRSSFCQQRQTTNSELANVQRRQETERIRVRNQFLADR